MLVAAGLLVKAPSSEAAFGQAANIFGKPTNTAGAVLSRRHLHRSQKSRMCSEGGLK